MKLKRMRTATERSVKWSFSSVRNGRQSSFPTVPHVNADSSYKEKVSNASNIPCIAMWSRPESTKEQPGSIGSLEKRREEL